MPSASIADVDSSSRMRRRSLAVRAIGVFATFHAGGCADHPTAAEHRRGGPTEAFQARRNEPSLNRWLGFGRGVHLACVRGLWSCVGHLGSADSRRHDQLRPGLAGGDRELALSPVKLGPIGSAGLSPSFLGCWGCSAFSSRDSPPTLARLRTWPPWRPTRR